ncbi:MAG: helix-turn-helix domain-containing protein [Thermoproteota archaeon]|nr:helix-turn-helix domain-containing protein [Thermoproteota archaeon]
MQRINNPNSKDRTINFSTLVEIPDKTGCKIIMSITNISKTVSQISRENNLPQSSTYKKIKKLLNLGLITIERVNIDEKGKRVIFYRSKIKSLEINLQAGDVFMKYNTEGDTAPYYRFDTKIMR